MPLPPRPGIRDYLMLHFIVLIWGITAILGKLITLEPGVLTAWRTGLAALTLFLILAVRGEQWPAWRDAGAMLATGLLIGFHWFLFFLSGRQGTVSGTLAGASTLALWVALLEPLLIRGRRWSWAEAGLAAGVSCGVVLLLVRVDPASGSLTVGDGKPFSGNGLFTAIWAAGVAALFSIINARLIRRHSALVITAYEMTGACAICTIGSWLLTPAGGVAWWPTPSDWVWLLALALVCTVFAYAACVEVQRRVSTFSLGMASNLEPVYGMVFAPLVFGAVEHQSLLFYLGTAVIIGCVVVHTMAARTEVKQGKGSGFMVQEDHRGT